MTPDLLKRIGGMPGGGIGPDTRDIIEILSLELGLGYKDDVKGINELLNIAGQIFMAHTADPECAYPAFMDRAFETVTEINPDDPDVWRRLIGDRGDASIKNSLSRIYRGIYIQNGLYGYSPGSLPPELRTRMVQARLVRTFYDEYEVEFHGFDRDYLQEKLEGIEIAPENSVANTPLINSKLRWALIPQRLTLLDEDLAIIWEFYDRSARQLQQDLGNSVHNELDEQAKQRKLRKISQFHNRNLRVFMRDYFTLLHFERVVVPELEHPDQE